MKSTAKRSRGEAGEHQAQGGQVGCTACACRAVPAPLSCACSHGGSYLEQHKCWGGVGMGVLHAGLGLGHGKVAGMGKSTPRWLEEGTLRQATGY